jgi:tetratricopeptide (TPR) repeat protein
MMLGFTNYSMIVSVELNVTSEFPSLRWLSLHELKGRYLRNLGKFSDAVQLMEKLVKIQEIILEGNHLNRLSSQHELASAYWQDGQIDKAIKLMKYVVEIKQRVFRKDHLSRARSESSLAFMLETLLEEG